MCRSGPTTANDSQRRPTTGDDDDANAIMMPIGPVCPALIVVSRAARRAAWTAEINLSGRPLEMTSNSAPSSWLTASDGQRLAPSARQTLASAHCRRPAFRVYFFRSGQPVRPASQPDDHLVSHHCCCHCCCLFICLIHLKAPNVRLLSMWRTSHISLLFWPKSNTQS